MESCGFFSSETARPSSCCTVVPKNLLLFSTYNFVGHVQLRGPVGASILLPIQSSPIQSKQEPLNVGRASVLSILSCLLRTYNYSSPAALGFVMPSCLPYLPRVVRSFSSGCALCSLRCSVCVCVCVTRPPSDSMYIYVSDSEPTENNLTFLSVPYSRYVPNDDPILSLTLTELVSRAKTPVFVVVNYRGAAGKRQRRVLCLRPSFCFCSTKQQCSRPTGCMRRVFFLLCLFLVVGDFLLLLCFFGVLFSMEANFLSAGVSHDFICRRVARVVCLLMVCRRSARPPRRTSTARLRQRTLPSS